MNRLEAIETTSKYGPGRHLGLFLDGVPLDRLVDAARPDLALLGLVPSLLGWLKDPQERELVWRRILPPTGAVAMAPVLMCPDDCDLWCSVVVAEVAPEESVVCWCRLGLDRTRPKPEEMPEATGSVVEWFSGLGSYCFRRSEYERCLAVFKRIDAEPRATPDRPRD